MNTILQEIGLIGIIPVVVIENAEAAEPLAQALIEGGLPCAEITFRTSAAEDTMKRISKKFPDMLLGAGTVLTVEQVKTATGAGAKFIVSPGFNPKVVEYCLANAILITPGIATPSEIEVALDYGLDVVKYFPAEALGGIQYLKAISAPFRDMKFIPTGGINENTLLTYLNFDHVLACGGSWMVKPDFIAQKKFDEITRLTRSGINILHAKNESSVYKR